MIESIDLFKGGLIDSFEHVDNWISDTGSTISLYKPLLFTRRGVPILKIDLGPEGYVKFDRWISVPDVYPFAISFLVFFYQTSSATVRLTVESEIVGATTLLEVFEEVQYPYFTKPFKRFLFALDENYRTLKVGFKNDSTTSSSTIYVSDISIVFPRYFEEAALKNQLEGYGLFGKNPATLDINLENVISTTFFPLSNRSLTQCTGRRANRFRLSVDLPEEYALETYFLEGSTTKGVNEFSRDYCLSWKDSRGSEPSSGSPLYYFYPVKLLSVSKRVLSYGNLYRYSLELQETFDRGVYTYEA